MKRVPVVAVAVSLLAGRHASAAQEAKDTGVMTAEIYGEALSGRAFSSGPVAAHASQFLFIGGAFDFELRMDWAIFEGIGVRYALGFDAGADAGMTPAGGSASLRMLEIALPFLSGVQFFPAPDVKGAIRIDWGFAETYSALPALANGWDFYFKARATACHDGGEAFKAWVCMEVSPTVYQNGWLPGVAVGVRVDF